MEEKYPGFFRNTIKNMNNTFFEDQEFEPDLSAPPEGSGINPKNPFENFTEYEDYNSDYREIVPQIDIPGCVIPFEPSRDEKRKIRHYFNIAGAGILIHLVAAYGIMTAIITVLQFIVMKKDGVKFSEASVQYLMGLENFFNESSINMGLNMLVLMTCSILVFLIGSKVSKIPVGSYFQTRDLTFKTIASYCIISFFIRYVGGFAGTAFEMIFNGVDMTVGTEMMNYQNPKTIAVTIVYTCIAAPVTEELLYRGFVLKNLSRVGQRFGIIMSALLFGLMHGNVSQFIFAFFMGVFFAHIDVKHNSLIPSMIVHAFANTVSIAVSYSGVLDTMIAAGITGFAMLALCAAGIVLYVNFYKKNRLPFTMPHQKLRNGTAVSSVLLIISVVVYTIITIINSFPSITDSLFD